MQVHVHQTIAGVDWQQSRGRKVRTPQSTIAANSRPPKALGYKARNRATETSKSRFAVMDVKRGNLHLQQDQIGWHWRGSRRQRVGCLSA